MTKRIVVIGGGPSGLSTAWHLLDGPQASQLDVTIYTLGWRLGGKGATGRGPDGRIQEHGIHGFMGFYWNSTRMLHAAYTELDDAGLTSQAAPPTLPRSIEQAMVPNDFSVDFLFAGRRFTEQPLYLPGNDGCVWTDTPEADLDQVIETLIGMAHDALTHHELPHDYWTEQNTGQRLIRFVNRITRSAVGKALQRALRHAAAGEHSRALSGLDHLTKKLLDHSLRGSASARSQMTVLDYLSTLIRGLLADHVLEPGFEVDSLDGMGYVDWLQGHGIHPVTLQTAQPHAPAIICFQYPNGDCARVPEMSAASYLGWMVRIVLSQGPPAMFFAAGTGETIIKPLYESLLQRGGKVEFFHQLLDVQLDADHNVERIIFRRQARLAPGVDVYDPLVDLPGTNERVWPDRPRWELLHPDDVAGIKAAQPTNPDHNLYVHETHADLESYWSAWKGVGEVVLERGRDFDEAVLAIPPSTFPYACPSLVADGAPSPLRTAMLGQTTCATAGVQLWLDETLTALGWDHPLSGRDRYMGVGFPNPLNGIVDFTDLIAYERWGADGGTVPKSLLYLCGPIPDLTDPLRHDLDDTRYPAIQYERTLIQTGQFLATAATWLPGAVHERPADPLGLNFDLLHTDQDVQGLARLATQYLKVNIDPSERYVMSPRGSAAARPHAWGSGIGHLALAGDWVYTGINVGSFEGAVMGGKLAAHALTGSPTLDEVYGFTILHPGLSDLRVEPMIDGG